MFTALFLILRLGRSVPLRNKQMTGKVGVWILGTIVQV